MKVCLFGGTGFIGRHLARRLRDEGHDVVVFTRRASLNPGADTVASQTTFVHVQPYTLSSIGPLFAEFKAPYAIVNLAGTSINSGRWTKRRKAEIMTSRMELTRAIVDAIMQVPTKPVALVNASAVGYYGSSSTQTFTEEADPGEGFLAEVTQAWEAAAMAASPDTRVVLARFGVVLGRDGGALPRMAMPYRLGVGGPIGDGRQWMSWIHVDDAARMLITALVDTALSGPLNITAPNPVPMTELGRAIGQALHRPHWLPVPAVALKVLFGEMSEILLLGQRVIPQKWMATGRDFLFPTIDKALADIFQRA
ncbi:MAG: TIGR01777 family oxidoreductase [Alicyclobacillus sp.]|nr:TIGR01777 family oxidoreductase [Alicyclobacillus sp.]